MSLTQIGFDIDATLSRYLDREALDRYYVELMKENASVNLVSRETSRGGFDRLAAESLLPLEVLPQIVGNYLDIGSGGGMPAIPLIQSGRVSGQSILVERTLKKAAALERIVSSLALPCRVLPRTFEELALRERFDLITLCYVKLDRSLLRKIVPLLSTNGHFVYYSGTESTTKNLVADEYTYTDPVQGILKHFTVFRTK